MDALQLLIQDHRTADALFDRYLGTSAEDARVRRQVVDVIITELSVHAAIEEQILYPGVKRALPDGGPLANEALDEHQGVKEVLAELDDMDAEDPTFDRKVRALIEDVRHHVGEEEGEMFPKLREALTRDQLAQMGEAMEAAKRIAPTRPHPNAPNEPPGNLVMGLVAGAVDRGRDLLAGRKRESTESGSAGGRRSPSGGKTSPGGKASSQRKSGRSRSGSVRAKGPVIHVMPEDGGGWRAASRGARAVARGDDKRDVVRRAREAAKRRGGRLVIHGRDGKIQEERTYGVDPRRSKG